MGGPVVSLESGPWARRDAGEEAEKKKAYATTTGKQIFGELFWPQTKTFQAGGRHGTL